MTVKEHWKGYVSKPQDLVDIMQQFVDDYEVCKEVYDVNECGIDDATWVHVDSVKEERDELESKIQQLEDALHNRNVEYNELYAKFRELEREHHNLQCEHREVLRGKKKPIKKLGKKKLDIKGFANIDDDDLPF